MKVYCAGIVHESNSFSPIETRLSDFGLVEIRGPGEKKLCATLIDQSHELAVMGILESRGHDCVGRFCASAEPGAPLNYTDFVTIRDTLLDDLEKAIPVDAIALFMHGAQMASSVDDCEGHILQKIREIVGPHVPIGVMLDLHANITPQMIGACSFIICCKEYPHIDFDETAETLADLLVKAAEKSVNIAVSCSRVPILGSFPTTYGPMKEFVTRVRNLEKQDDVLSISIAHGFPWTDIEDISASVIVVTDDNPDLARSISEKLAVELYTIRESVSLKGLSVEEALANAALVEGGPVIIADYADNAGGGAPSDSTFILRKLLCMPDRFDVAIGMFYDPAAVKKAAAAGVGQVLGLEIGGHMGPQSGVPLHVNARVLAIRTDVEQSTLPGFPASPLGMSVAIQVGRVAIVLNSIRQQVFDPVCFEAHGIDIRQMKIAVVKSSNHFRAKFEAIARDIIYCCPPGTLTLDFSQIPYSKLCRPVWPLDMPPFYNFGRHWQ